MQIQLIHLAKLVIQLLPLPTGWKTNQPEMMVFGEGKQTTALQLAQHHTQNYTLLDRPYTETK